MKYRKNKKHNDNLFPSFFCAVKRYNVGFTLVESIIVIGIFSFLIMITVVIVQNVIFGSGQQFLALDNIDNARSVTSRFTNEIRNATVGADGSYELGATGDNQITFYSKSPGQVSVNKISYYLSGNTLYKEVTPPSSSPPSYNNNVKITSIVLRDVVNQGIPIFTYYDGNYNGVGNSLSQPINANTVRFIKMSLRVLNQVQSQSQSQFSVSVGVSLRNIKDNLGN